MSRTVLVFATLAAICLLSACTPCEKTDPDSVALTLPSGTAEAGKQAFEDLRCTACHAVSGIEGLSEPLAQVPVPDLGMALAGQTRGRIASSIVMPDHTTMEGSDEDPSLMTDYSNTVTVQQLSDLVVFLQDSTGKE